MNYRERAKKVSPVQLRSTNMWAERPAIVPTAIYTLEEAALVLALSQRAVEHARFAEGDKRLRYCKIGDRVRITGEELLRWVKAHEVLTGTDTALYDKDAQISIGGGDNHASP